MRSNVNVVVASVTGDCQMPYKIIPMRGGTRWRDQVEIVTSLGTVTRGEGR